MVPEIGVRWHSRTRPRVLLSFALMCVAVLLGGCSGGDSGEDAAKKQFTELLKRPDIEQAGIEYQDMLAAIRAKLVQDLSISAFIPDEDGLSGSGCGFEFPDLSPDGQRRFYSSGKSPGNISDANWPRAVSIVTELARHHGFGEPEPIVDRPSDHEVSYKSVTDAEIIFGTGTNTTLSVTTGCHLTAEAHKRGYPAPKEPLY